MYILLAAIVGARYFLVSASMTSAIIMQMQSRTCHVVYMLTMLRVIAEVAMHIATTARP